MDLDQQTNLKELMLSKILQWEKTLIQIWKIEDETFATEIDKVIPQVTKLRAMIAKLIDPKDELHRRARYLLELAYPGTTRILLPYDLLKILLLDNDYDDCSYKIAFGNICMRYGIIENETLLAKSLLDISKKICIGHARWHIFRTPDIIIVLIIHDDVWSSFGVRTDSEEYKNAPIITQIWNGIIHFTEDAGPLMMYVQPIKNKAERRKLIKQGYTII